MSEKNKSIIHPKFNGTLVLISGLHGLGKTLLAVTMENPANTAMIDFDIKSAGLAQDLGIWYRAPAEDGDPANFDVSKLATWFTKALMEVPDGKTHLIIDNATWAEAGLGEIVRRNPVKYNVKPKNAQSGSYGGVNPGVTILWSNIFTYLQSKGINTVTAINHMSQPWTDGAPIANRFTIKGNKVFHQISSLALILVPANTKRGGHPPVPSAVIVKEALHQTSFDPKTGEFSVKRALPTRLPVCNWGAIKNYFDKPADFDNPMPGENWSQKERDAYSDWLSNEQVDWVMKVSSYSDEEAETPEVADKQQQPVPKQSRGDGKPQPEKSYRFPATAAEKFWDEVQDNTNGYYRSPHHLLEVIGGWFDYSNKDTWEAKMSMAVDHAQSANKEQPELPN